MKLSPETERIAAECYSLRQILDEEAARIRRDIDARPARVSLMSDYTHHQKLYARWQSKHHELLDRFVQDVYGAGHTVVTRIGRT